MGVDGGIGEAAGSGDADGIGDAAGIGGNLSATGLAERSSASLAILTMSGLLWALSWLEDRASTAESNSVESPVARESGRFLAPRAGLIKTVA